MFADLAGSRQLPLQKEGDAIDVRNVLHRDGRWLFCALLVATLMHQSQHSHGHDRVVVVVIVTSALV